MMHVQGAVQEASRCHRMGEGCLRKGQILVLQFMKVVLRVISGFQSLKCNLLQLLNPSFSSLRQNRLFG